MSTRFAAQACRAARLLAALVCCASAGRAGVPAKAPGPPPELGVNLEEVHDFGRSFMFADAMKHSRPWGRHGTPHDEEAEVDADGWPTGDAGVQILVDVPGEMIAGRYRLSFRGKAEVTGTVPIRNQAFDPRTGTTSADVVVPVTASEVTLRFAGQPGGVKDVKLLRPDHQAGDTFSRPFLARIAPFNLLRSMDYLATNGNPQVHWRDRTLPGHASQQRRDARGKNVGASWEHLIEVANLAKKDLWINVPDQATDDYILQLARLLRSSLLPERKVYTEWSNEVWNDAAPFEQTRRNYAATRAELAAGRSDLAYDGQDDPYVLAWRRIARRGKEISDIFRSVFGDEAMMTRIRPVLASQLARPEVLTEGLEFIRSVHGPPDRYFYGCAAALYIGVDEEIQGRAGVSVDRIVAAMPAHARQLREWLVPYSAWCHYYRLRLLAYEGGQHLEGYASLEAKLAAQRDGRMKEMLLLALRSWFEAGGGLFVYYNLCSPWGRWGSWGLSDDVRSEATPKWEAVHEVLGRPTPPVQVGKLMPAALAPADAFAAVEHYDRGSRRVLKRPGAYSMYLVRVPVGGRYTVSTALSGSRAATARLLVDSAPIATWSASQGSSMAAAVELAPGLHVVRVEPGAGEVSFEPLVVSR